MQNKKLFARKLRTQQTDAEKLLWFKLRNKQLNGNKFRRQQQIGKYIIDFVSFEKMLVVELDGSQHLEIKNKLHDQKRSKYLENLGYNVLRFLDNEVFSNVEGVLQTIHLTLTLSSKERENSKASI